MNGAPNGNRSQYIPRDVHGSDESDSDPDAEWVTYKGEVDLRCFNGAASLPARDVENHLEADAMVAEVQHRFADLAEAAPSAADLNVKNVPADSDDEEDIPWQGNLEDDGTDDESPEGENVDVENLAEEILEEEEVPEGDYNEDDDDEDSSFEESSLDDNSEEETPVEGGRREVLKEQNSEGDLPEDPARDEYPSYINFRRSEEAADETISAQKATEDAEGKAEAAGEANLPVTSQLTEMANSATKFFNDAAKYARRAADAARECAMPIIPAPFTHK